MGTKWVMIPLLALCIHTDIHNYIYIYYIVTYYYILFHIITTHPPCLDFVFGRWKVNGNSQGPQGPTFRHRRQVVTSESYVRKTSLLDMSAERQVGAMSYDVMDMWLGQLGQLGQLDIVDMDITWDIYYMLCIIYILYIYIYQVSWSWQMLEVDPLLTLTFPYF